MQEGPVSGRRFTSAISKLAKSITKAGLSHAAHGAPLETILLSSFAGSIVCADFPGPVFGMTAAGAKEDPGALNLWLTVQEKFRDKFFPSSAKEWFESWGVTDKVTMHRYFYCPYKNAKGYLGYKTDRDPPYDNEGVYLDKQGGF